jgi:hypothetical protein
MSWNNRLPALSLLLTCSLLLAGCLEAVEPPAADPNADSDGDGLSDGYESEFGLDPDDSTDAPTCQGRVEFCLKTYDNFTFAETHNSFATNADGVYYPANNHDTGLSTQWNGGVRAFMLDTHHKSATQTAKEDVVFCHGDPDQLIHPCGYSEVDAFAWLEQLRDFMDGSPTDVVTILLENYVPIDHLEYLFNETGLLNRTWVHTPGEGWPTLGEMVLSNRTLVVFWDEGDDPAYPWLHHAWSHSWDTPYGERNEDEFSCEVGRGDGELPVWHLNNWLSNAAGFSDPQRSEDVNDKETLLARALECWEEVGKRPTFIAVDWWDDGDVVGVTQELNLMESWNSTTAM